MDTNTQDVLRKIAALLKTANDSAATEGEVQAALGRVSHLAAKYGLADSEIEAAVGADGEAELRIDHEDMAQKVMHKAARTSRWDMTLLAACALATDCRTFRRSYGNSHQALFAYGLPVDLEVCAALFQFVRSAMRKQVGKFRKEAHALGQFWVQANSIEGRSFKDGFCAGLHEAAKAEKARQERGDDTAEVNLSGSTALVPVAGLVKAKANALAAFAENALSLKKPRRSPGVYRDPEAFGAGERKGKATSLSRRTVN